MQRSEYLQALEQLGLKPCGIKTSQLLGLGIRQLHRLSCGSHPVTKRTSQLLTVLLNDGRQRFEPDTENETPTSATTKATRTRNIKT